jgi:hypothetical protein
MYFSKNSNKLVGYTNLNSASDGDYQNSTYGYVFHLGSSLIIWPYKKKNIISVSNTTFEYRGEVNVGTKVVWIHNIMGKLIFLHNEFTIV